MGVGGKNTWGACPHLLESPKRGFKKKKCESHCTKMPQSSNERGGILTLEANFAKGLKIFKRIKGI